MGLHRTCDLCKTEFSIMDFDLADHNAVPSFMLMAPGVGRPKIDTCIPCLTKVVKAIAERFPHESASPAFHDAARAFLRGLAELEKHHEAWVLEHPQTKEG